MHSSLRPSSTDGGRGSTRRARIGHPTPQCQPCGHQPFSLGWSHTLPAATFPGPAPAGFPALCRGHRHPTPVLAKCRGSCQVLGSSLAVLWPWTYSAITSAPIVSVAKMLIISVPPVLPPPATLLGLASGPVTCEGTQRGSGVTCLPGHPSGPFVLSSMAQTQSCVAHPSQRPGFRATHTYLRAIFSSVTTRLLYFLLLERGKEDERQEEKH